MDAVMVSRRFSFFELCYQAAMRLVAGRSVTILVKIQGRDLSSRRCMKGMHASQTLSGPAEAAGLKIWKTRAA